MTNNKELQTWEEYTSIGKAYDYFLSRTQINVACPECGRPLWRRNDVVLTTYPEQYQYECDCGWRGTAFR